MVECKADIISVVRSCVRLRVKAGEGNSHGELCQGSGGVEEKFKDVEAFEECCGFV